MLPKQLRLSAKDFQRVYKNGFKSKGEYGMLIGLKESNVDSPKLGIVVNKKVGNAVVRHMLTRKIREIATEAFSKEKSPLLYQYVAFKNEEDFSKLKKEFGKQLSEIVKKLK